MLRTPGEEEDGGPLPGEHPDGTGQRDKVGAGQAWGWVWDLLAQTQLCGVGLVLLVTKPFGGSRRGAQRRLPHTFPLPTHPKPLLPAVLLQGTAGLCPQGTLLQCHPRQENRSQLPAWLQEGLQEILVLTEKYPTAN